MAVRFFEGFDFSSSSTNFFNGWSENIGSITHDAVFHNNDAVSGIKATAFVNGPDNSGSRFSGNRTSASSINGDFMGHSSGGVTNTNYTSITAKTRAAYNTQKGKQIGVRRDLIRPTLASNDELWFSIDVGLGALSDTTRDATFASSEEHNDVFRWGDVAIRTVSATRTDTNIFTVLFSIRNNGTEVATLSVPSVLAGNVQSEQRWMWLLIRVKLHATTGLIEVYSNGNSQSVAYANQNTVNTISAGSANIVYFGIPVLDNGSTLLICGAIDNVIIDDASFPSGRPFVRLLSPAAVTLNTDFVSSTGGSLMTALTGSALDTNQLRGNSLAAKIYYSNTAIITTGFHDEILGFYSHLMRVSNRYPFSNRTIRWGISLASVDFLDEYSDKVVPFYASTAPVAGPPASVISESVVFTKSGGAKFVLADLASVRQTFQVSQ